jgi:hypothetical protein
MEFSATSGSHNVVERVAEALKQQQPSIEVPKEIICAASEKYRMLAIHVRVGSIKLQPASQKDTSDRRAAALLELCTRQYHLNDDYCGNKKNQALPPHIPWSSLAAAVHAKSHHPIQQLQHILINFLQPNFTESIKKRPIQGVFSIDNGAAFERSRSLRRRVHTTSYKDADVTLTLNRTTGSSVRCSASEVKYAPKILHELVIRLAGFLDDPHGIQMKTSQLLGDIYSYYENGNNYDAKGDDTDTTRYSDTAERRGHLYDLQRYASAYEAAALYYVATTTYQTNQ